MKVHFAGNRGESDTALRDAGVNYRLHSFYDIQKRGSKLNMELINSYQHVIIDSGLYTLMFGADSKKPITVDFCTDWMNRYVEFINTAPFKNASFVELDVQKKISPEYAWELRREMKRRINKGTVINVYHLEDDNPDKLIDFADYIAVSEPELRFNVSEKERHQITDYIARKAVLKGKRVHLLGCTEIKYLRAFQYCTTCDSTSWQEPFRYGSLRSKEFGVVPIKSIREYSDGKPDSYNEIYHAAVFALANYKKNAGDQS